MKIAFLTHYFPKLSETFILNQAVGLLEKGHEVKIFATERPDEDIKHEIVDQYDLQEKTTYFETPSNYASGIATVARLASEFPHTIPAVLSSLTRGEDGGLRLATLRQFLRRDTWDFDIYHAHFGNVGRRWDFLKEYVDVPFIVSFYGRDASIDLPENTRHYRRLFNETDQITVLSDDMRNEIVQRGAPASKTILQPLPVNIQEFEYSHSNYSNDQHSRILTVARFTEKKGLDDALEAIDAVSNHHNIKWIIAGDGPLRNSFELEINNRGLQDSVEILGWVPQKRVQELMERAHLFLLPSKTSEDGDKEGTPTVLIEAQATGIPILSTYHAGIPEIISEGDSGILVPENDHVKLTNALDQLLTNPEKWELMSRKGREFVEKNHSRAAVAERLTEIYDSAREA